MTLYGFHIKVGNILMQFSYRKLKGTDIEVQWCKKIIFSLKWRHGIPWNINGIIWNETNRYVTTFSHVPYQVSNCGYFNIGCLKIYKASAAEYAEFAW